MYPAIAETLVITSILLKTTIKIVAKIPISISEFPGDLFLSIDLSQLEFGKTESLDIEKISLEAVAMQATPHAKIAAITNKRITEYNICLLYTSPSPRD